jgi:multisubunit Na+/H+ antiporter MnhG subunit
MDLYVIKLDEIMWGGLLVAITMAIHGTGMFSILRLVDLIKERYAPLESFAGGLGLVILASLLIVITNIIEVMVWTVFFFLQGAQTNHHTAFYNAMLNYTTLQASYLPQRWHLLEPLLGMAGLLTVAWSTGILYMLAQDFQETQMRVRKQRREREGKTNLNPQEDASASNDKA